MVTDMLGNEIKVGKRIVYPGRRGSILWMNYGEIVEMNSSFLKVRRLRENSYSWRIRESESKLLPSSRQKIVTLYNFGGVIVVGEK